MYRALLLWLFLSSAATASIVDSQIWINELHYDNDGADQNEFIEVVAPEAFTGLSDVTITLYNGSSGATYGSVASLDDFTAGATVDGFTFYTWDVSLQNGAPDGLALSQGSQVLQFLSYEGEFTATSGVAQGLSSTALGVQEPASTPLGNSLQLGGIGDSYFDFAWNSPAQQTYGALNRNQSVVPEPASMALWLSTAVWPLLLWWRKRAHRHAEACGQSPNR